MKIKSNTTAFYNQFKFVSNTMNKQLCNSIIKQWNSLKFIEKINKWGIIILERQNNDCSIEKSIDFNQ